MQLVQFENNMWGIRKLTLFGWYYYNFTWEESGSKNEWRCKTGNEFFHQCMCNDLERAQKIINELKNHKTTLDKMRVIYKRKI